MLKKLIASCILCVCLVGCENPYSISRGDIVVIANEGDISHTYTVLRGSTPMIPENKISIVSNIDGKTKSILPQDVAKVLK